LRWNYGRGKGAFYAKHATVRDGYALRRLVSDAGVRVRRMLVKGPRAPRQAVGELVALGGLLSGAASWGVRVRLLPRLARIFSRTSKGA
jgi:hypothetical protein